MYTALLQNQVLGIDNLYLLNEIHNHDENNCPTAIKNHELFSKNPDQSPFNSKYSVLNFGSAASQAKKGIFSSNSQALNSSSPLTALTNERLLCNKTPFLLSPVVGFDEDRVIVPKQNKRVIQKIPFKVLDAPALQDDFYLNLVDWSSTNNLAVGLSSCIYIWSASSSKVTKLYDLGNNDCVTSVCWSKQG